MIGREAHPTKLKRDNNPFAWFIELNTGKKSYTVTDYELGHSILREAAFGKTSLEWEKLRYILTAPGDVTKEGSAFTHKYDDEYWQFARKLNEAIIKRASESRSEKAAHKTNLDQFTNDFFDKLFQNGDLTKIDANKLGQEFSSKYIFSILFKNPEALAPELIERLNLLFEKASTKIFILYTLDQEGGRLSELVQTLAAGFITKTKEELNAINEEMRSIITEALNQNPDSYFKKALQDYSNEHLNGVPISEDIEYGQAVTLILAGIETTAGIIASGLRELAINKELAKMFFSEEISTADFVTRILAMHPPADLYRDSGEKEIHVADEIVPPHSVIRIDAKKLHKTYIESKGEALVPKDLVTFGEGIRKCAGYSVAMAELIGFFDAFKKRASGVKYKGNPFNKRGVKQGLSRKPADARICITAKTV